MTIPRVRRHLFVPTKYDYVRGKRPPVGCILCEVAAGRDTVTRLEVHGTDAFVVSLNLHPYNPGHLLIFPRRHVLNPQELTVGEVLEAHDLQLKSMAVLGELYGPPGFNVGYNLGHASGASIDHLHLHVVPRFERELGFMDIIGGAKILVEDPIRTQERIGAVFSRK